MTPEKARALREDATHGPWEVEEFEEQYAGCPPTTKFYLGSDDFQNIATAETTERHYDQTRANFALIAAAPALAGVVAELRYEYAVQIPVATDGPKSPWWKYLMYTPTMAIKTTTLPRVARWFPAEGEAEEYAKDAVGDQFRIVRRLVSWTEVVS